MRSLVLFVCAVHLSFAAGTFETDVQPVLRQSCAMCHNDKLASGSLNLAPFNQPQSVAAMRDSWERILRKLRSGEMPPKGIPPLAPDKLAGLIRFVEMEFEKADRNAKPDPGRVTVRRLNRVEYSNTIRDLLAVSFRAQDEFPPDDSGYGFDNISDVLTVSPLLLDKYVSAAEKIATRAISGEPLPKPGLFNKREAQKRSGSQVIELYDRIDYEADYIVRTMITGHRGAQGKPVPFVMSIDGKPVIDKMVPTEFTLVNRQGGATQRIGEEVRIHLTEGPHTFRAEIPLDEISKAVPEANRLNSGRNIYPDNFEIAGPFPSKELNTVSRKRILVCDPATGKACVERIVSTLARRAYRRPVQSSEVADVVKVYDKARAAGYTAEQGIQFAIQAILISPRFLYRMERDPKPGANAPVSDLELASRLSYYLWSSMPDEELLRLAETRQLRQPAVLDAQIKRMIADAKSAAFAESFAGQWLEIRSLDAVKPDPAKFPEWGPQLREAMKTETRMFFEAVLRDNRSLSDFIDGRYTFINEQLARHYGVEGVKGPEFRRVELTDNQRSGILTQASVLTVSSYPSRTSPVLRGKYVLENILGAPPPPPPGDVPTLNEANLGTAATVRQRFEQHRTDPVCASCHSKMDVLGFGLENYDAIGRWRTNEGTLPIDPTGTFPNGKAFATPAEMKTLLRAELPEFARCVTEKMLTYALGRGVESYDRLALNEISRKLKANNYKFQTLITAIVQSAPFQARRGEPVKEIAP